MFTFTNVSGDPIPKWANILLNTLIDPLNYEEYNNLVHKVDNYFDDYNKTHCSNCKRSSDSPKFAYTHGCCSYCASARGYFDGDKSKRMFASHRDLFDKVHGFFDESIYGCSLPRHVRSSTCLAYSCDYNMTKEILPTVERMIKLRGYY